MLYNIFHNIPLFLNYLFWATFNKKRHGALIDISPLIYAEAEHTHESQLGAKSTRWDEWVV